MIWILEHFSTPEYFPTPKFLAPKEHHLFFTDRRLLKKEHDVFLKRLGVGNADGLRHKIHHFLL